MKKPNLKNRLYEFTDTETGEEWRRVNMDDFCSSFIVSNHGRIFNLLTNKFIQPRLCNDKLYTHLFINKEIKFDFQLGMLVALSYVANPNGYSNIRHIDGNQLNNHYTNLEWSDKKEYLKRLGTCNWKIDIKSITETNHLPESFWKDLDDMPITPCEDIDNIGKDIDEDPDD